jgi:hypothetical protein
MLLDKAAAFIRSFPTQYGLDNLRARIAVADIRHGLKAKAMRAPKENFMVFRVECKMRFE